MSLNSIKARLARLECRSRVRAAGSLPPGFWDAVFGTVPPEQLDPETRQLVEGLYGRPDGPDPIEQRIAEARRPQKGLKELSPEAGVTLGGSRHDQVHAQQDAGDATAHSPTATPDTEQQRSPVNCVTDA
jgi:hypothetical protein